MQIYEKNNDMKVCIRDSCVSFIEKSLEISTFQCSLQYRWFLFFVIRRSLSWTAQSFLFLVNLLLYNYACLWDLSLGLASLSQFQNALLDVLQYIVIRAIFLPIHHIMYDHVIF